MGSRSAMNTCPAWRLLGRAGHKMLIGAHPKNRVTTAPAAGAARPHLAAQNRPGGGRVRSEGRCRMQVSAGPSRDWGCDGGRVFRARSLTEGGYVAWVLRLVEIGAE